ncbi:flagellar hook-length control protein [Hyphomicrobium denitrificans 1NES1]|uniref:Flagellar hook-length control protein n=1 Tax=Hyphomicrobium denitrificans 1NES1 TaxID=670307 RepID=N0B6Z8_9HYPH|nr:flagellar hook-length control protein FliK [Hyphomicrobium denitrificans]AGK59394.1 flagellar hook-length control protein [Hyphomicrobium denitrificans 1NES1]
MTEAASRAAQSQSIIDTLSKSASAKSNAQAHRAGSKPIQKQQDTDGSNDRVRDRSIDKAERRDNHSAFKSIDTTAKASEKSHRGNEKDDDSEKSFEATIDTLGSQTPPGNAPASVPATPPAGWGAEIALRTAQDQASNDDSKSTPTNLKTAALPGHLLRQASVVALLDAKQRLLAAQDSTAQVSDSTSEETMATPVMVHAREAHWVFDDANAASSTRVFETLTSKGSKENPLAALTGATTSRGEDGVSKASADMMTPRAVGQAPANNAATQQNFSGAQDGRPGSREQSGTTDVSTRRIVDTAVAAPAEHISQDSPEISGMSAATQQVRSGVLTALADDSSNAQVSNPSQMTDRPPVTGQVLRTIDLTLSPSDLGTVRLKLSLKSSALDIDAEASKASTAKLLDDDRKGLEQSLRDAGYDVKSLKIADISAGSNSTLNNSLNNSGSSFQDGSQARANFAGRQDESMPRREGGMPDQSQQRQRDNNQKTSPAPDVASGRQANAIYI